MERGQRRITVNYAKRQQGRKMVGGQSSYLPLKDQHGRCYSTNFCLKYYSISCNFRWLVFTNRRTGLAWQISLRVYPQDSHYILCFMLRQLSFLLFSIQRSHLMHKIQPTICGKSGGFIPGIRPGQHSADYIDAVSPQG